MMATYSDHEQRRLDQQSGAAMDRAQRISNARLIAAAPAMYELIGQFGDAVTDMFEQMLRGRWTDEEGHDVQMNAQMIALKPLITKAIELRAAIAKPKP